MASSAVYPGNTRQGECYCISLKAQKQMANPNPDTSGLKPFEKGQSGNPGGKTREQRAAEVKAAEDSAKLRALITAKLLAEVEGGADPLDLLEPNALRLFKDSEDRAHGTPKSTSEIEAKLNVTKNALDLTDDELAAYLTGTGGKGTSEA